MPDTCAECDRVLDESGECWYCNYQQLSSLKSRTDERFEEKISRMERERDDLNGRIRDSESDKYRLEDKVRDLERKQRSAW